MGYMDMSVTIPCLKLSDSSRKHGRGIYTDTETTIFVMYCNFNLNATYSFIIRIYIIYDTG